VELVLGFIGGLAAVALKGGVDFYFEWRRDRRALRSAARLLGHELEMVDLWLALSIADQAWVPPGTWIFDRDVWRETKATLASGVSAEVWRSVEAAYRSVGLAEEAFAGAQSAGRRDLGSEQTREMVEGYTTAIAAGADALRRVSQVPALGSGAGSRGS
jgi:hypothetical protein